MPRTERVLFVREGNRHRGPTAEQLDANTTGPKTRSAGLSPLARVQLADELPAWADLVFVTEKRLLRMLRERFPGSAAEVICLAVSDDFQFQ